MKLGGLACCYVIADLVVVVSDDSIADKGCLNREGGGKRPRRDDGGVGDPRRKGEGDGGEWQLEAKDCS